MTIQEQIEMAMAKAFFASAWADAQDEKDIGDPTGVNLSGKEIMNVMPTEIDPAALHAAKTLHFDMVRANAVPDEYKCGLGLEWLYAHVLMLEDGGDRELTPENFGHYCAMQAMGHGVGLGDAFGEAVRSAITVPYVEFGSHSLQNDY